MDSRHRRCDFPIGGCVRDRRDRPAEARWLRRYQFRILHRL